MTLTWFLLDNVEHYLNNSAIVYYSVGFTKPALKFYQHKYGEGVCLKGAKF